MPRVLDQVVDALDEAKAVPWWVILGVPTLGASMLALASLPLWAQRGPEIPSLLFVTFMFMYGTVASVAYVAAPLFTSRAPISRFMLRSHLAFMLGLAVVLGAVTSPFWGVLVISALGTNVVVSLLLGPHYTKRMQFGVGRSRGIGRVK